MRDLTDEMVGTMLEEHFANYGHSPKGPELQRHTNWALGLDKAVLEYCLDTEHHRENASGRIRPKVADMKDLAKQFKRDRGDYRDLERFKQRGPAHDNTGCQYCIDGQVHDIIKENGRWRYGEIGLCKCKGGNAIPRKNITRFALKWDMPVEAVIAQVMLVYLEWSLHLDNHDRPVGLSLDEILDGIGEKLFGGAPASVTRDPAPPSNDVEVPF